MLKNLINLKKEFLKKEGVTLITLIITIIILLILAGVIINIALNSNNVFEKAKIAKVESSKSSLIENVQLSLLLRKAGMESAIIDNDTVNDGEQLGERQPITQATMDDVVYEIRKKGYEVKIKDKEVIVSCTPHDLTVRTGQTKEFTINVQEITSTTPIYYVKIDGDFYEFTFSENMLQIAKEPSELSEIEDVRELSVESSDEAVIQPSLTNNTMTLTALSNGQSTIYIKINDKTYRTYNLSTIQPQQYTVADILQMDSTQLQNIMGKYVVNYFPDGNKGIGKRETDRETADMERKKWRLYHIDAETERIYLISASHITNIPTGSGNYAGSASITNPTLKALNSKYFEYLESTNQECTGTTMKMVAFGMDTALWNQKFVDTNTEGGFGDYAIGGPTVELMFKALNRKFGWANTSQEFKFGDKDTTYSTIENDVNVQKPTINLNGYMLSADGGTSWEYRVERNLTNGPEFYGYTWVVSPHADRSFSAMRIQGNITVDHNFDFSDALGYSPVVCLKEGVKLEADGENWRLVK